MNMENTGVYTTKKKFSKKILNFAVSEEYAFLKNKIKELPVIQYDNEFDDLYCTLLEIDINPIIDGRFSLYIGFQIINGFNIYVTIDSTDLELYNMNPSNQKDIFIFDKLVNSNSISPALQKFIFALHTE